jgi:hypothetical protein
MLKLRSFVGVAAALIATPLMGLPAWADTCANTNLFPPTMPALTLGANSPLLFNTMSSGLQGSCSFDGLTFSAMSIQLNSGSLGAAPSITFGTIGNEIGMTLGYNAGGGTDFLWKFTVTANDGLLIDDAFASLSGNPPATLGETIDSNPTPPGLPVQLASFNLSLPGTASGGATFAPTSSIVAMKDQLTSDGGAASGLFNGFSLVPGPVVGAGLPGLVTACVGLIGFARRRRRQIA